MCIFLGGCVPFLEPFTCKNENKVNINFRPEGLFVECQCLLYDT